MEPLLLLIVVRERPTVVGVPAPPDEALILEAIDQADHDVAMNPQPVRQLPLGLPIAFPERHQHRVHPRIGPQRREPAVKVVGQVGAQLRQQERNALVERRDPSRAVIHITETSTHGDSLLE